MTRGRSTYSYCGNNPTNMIDPTGHEPVELSLITIGAIFVGCVALGYAIGAGIDYAINGENSAVAKAGGLGKALDRDIVKPISKAVSDAGEWVGKRVENDINVLSATIKAAAAAVAVGHLAKENDRTNKNDKPNTVYVIRDLGTKEVKYVGRTTNEIAREYYHTKIDTEKYTSKYLGDKFYPVAQGLSREEVRGLEQKLIDKYSLQILGNKINGISPNNKNIETYLEAAEKFLMDRAENELLNMLGF